MARQRERVWHFTHQTHMFLVLVVDCAKHMDRVAFIIQINSEKFVIPISRSLFAFEDKLHN